MPTLQPLAPIPSVPLRDRVTQAAGVIAQNWALWFNAVLTTLRAVARLVGSVSLTGQAASIAATDVPTPTLTASLYSLTYVARVTQAASVSSSLAVTAHWTSGGVSCSQSSVALTGNTTATVGSGTVTMNVDAGTAVRYSTTYTSSGATAMQYALDVRLTVVP